MDFSRYGETVAVSNSLRSYLNLETYHRTDSDVDQWLKEKDIHRIAVLLVDALGTSVLKKHLNDDSFLLSHMYKSITPVFPPTTSASTTSIRTGKMPCETGWLGWNQYFKEKDDNIILFLNRSQYGNQEYPGFSYKALRSVLQKMNWGNREILSGLAGQKRMPAAPMKTCGRRLLKQTEMKVRSTFMLIGISWIH